MTEVERIRVRNTARVQVAVAVGCVLVAVLLLFVLTLPGTTTGIPGSVATLGVLAAWMTRRARVGFRRVRERPLAH